ncbi:MAG: DNA mismatch repair endonuclease MutL, partial [Clostridia bacterium]|nr:DNA mismatch repair endonuclease MutL [Clostridia bacterium]
MPRINQLDFEIANLIAAGEVVERPSSVMKELIENSIDSGATNIVAEIKRGGVSLIRVSDNGCGIEKEDLPVAILRHATSKIRDKEDLLSIMTLGFRGEALAAISSVSNLTIISKPKDKDFGCMLTSTAGKVTDISDVGCADGTTVVVEDLFGNVPARRKFLKKDSTEAMNVSALVEKVALSRPDISIQLLIDGEEKFKTPGDGNLLNTIYSIYGKEFSSKLIEVDATANGILVKGYIGRSDNVRKNRNLQNVFINGRYVKSMTAMAAIEKAYTSYIAPEAFPTCVLFITIDPSLVDVNVHPAKLEVKFSSEAQVFEAVYYSVKNAIETYNYRPELEFTKKNDPYESLRSFIPVDDNKKVDQISFKVDKTEPAVRPVERSAAPSFSGTRDVRLDTPVRASSGIAPTSNKAVPAPSQAHTLTPKDSLSLLDRFRTARAQDFATDFKEETVPEKNPTPAKDITNEQTHNYKLLGEAFDCYIFVEYEGELLVIDKHAAHERVIFEDLKRQNEKDGRVASQELLLPIAVSLSAPQAQIAV